MHAVTASLVLGRGHGLEPFTRAGLSAPSFPGILQHSFLYPSSIVAPHLFLFLSQTSFQIHLHWLASKPEHFLSIPKTCIVGMCHHAIFV